MKTCCCLIAVYFMSNDSALSAETNSHRQPTSCRPTNILFIISDDLKASTLGCYGNELCQTPNIDRLAKDSMVFESAYCQGTWCAPSRTSLMHSRYQDSQGINLGQHFRKHGWHSVRVGKIYHMRVPGDIIAGTDGNDIPSSWDQRFNSMGREAHTPGDYACLNLNVFTDSPANRQSTRMPHRMFVTVQHDGDGNDQPDGKSATKAIELLRENQHRPFFLAVGLVRPHYPMVAPRTFFQQHPWQKIALPHVPENDLDDIPRLGMGQTSSMTNPIGKYPDNQKRMWQGYYAAVSFMDQQVGRILDELDRLRLRESTVVVFTSDHGYHLGEHTFWQKSNLHEEVVRVPLIIDAPKMPSGRTASLVELVDIYPTVSDLTDLPIPDSVQGRTLRPILQNPDHKVREAALSLHKGFGLRTSETAYMQYADGTEELYDMTTDPKQFSNRCNEPSFQAIRKKMKTMLRNRIQEFGLKQQARRNKPHQQIKP